MQRSTFRETDNVHMSMSMSVATNSAFEKRVTNCEESLETGLNIVVFVELALPSGM